MLAMSIMSLICTAGIAFYVRFVVALYRELKSPRCIYRYCVQLDFDEPKAIDPRIKLITTPVSKEGTTNE
jgi:hypothetical protein